MDPPIEEVDIPMPLNSAYPRAHAHVSNMFHQYHYHDHDHDHDHHHHDEPSSNGQLIPITLNHHHHHHDHVMLSNNKHQVRYRECLKNHAASKGGNVRDGCGEFMPSGEEETIEALICSACNCHRNFHRKEVEGETTLLMINNTNKGRKVIELGHHKNMITLSPAGLNGATTTAGGGDGRSRGVPIIPYNMGSLLVYSDQSDGQDEVGGGGTVTASPGVAYMGFPPPPSTQHHNQILKKRFRTKFTPEQKEKMFNFAEKVGWTIQKQEESELQLFCQEVGVKRKVLKVWMHNNRHNLNKKTSPTTNGS